MILCENDVGGECIFITISVVFGCSQRCSSQVSRFRIGAYDRGGWVGGWEMQTTLVLCASPFP